MPEDEAGELVLEDLVAESDLDEPEVEPFGGPLSLYEGSQRPFLMFDADDLPGIRERIAVEGSVAALLWSRIGTFCDREVRIRPEATVYDPYTEQWNANIARACAFQGLVGEDAERLRRGATVLLAMQTDVHHTSTAPDSIDKSTILGGPAVMGYAQAYDLLMAQPELAFATAEEAELARSLLVEHADRLRDFYLVDWRALLVLTRNNHNIKHAAGVGMAALAVPEDEGALDRLSFGVTELMYHLFTSQTTVDGGYAEGPAYLQYSAVSYFPFLYALHRGLDGGSIDLWHSCATTLDDTCRPQVRSVSDPWLDERFGPLHGWAFHMTMPNGSLIPLDDTRGGVFAWPFVEAQLPGGPWMYYWHHGRPPYSTGASLDLAMDTIALPIDLEEWRDPGETEPLAVVLPEAGQAVFRTGFTAEDGYLLLLGEHGKARLGGHEHPDATSFSWYAGGCYAFIDTGYFGYTERLETAVADQHSLVLVDGSGPPTGLLGGLGTGVDAYLEGCEIEDTPLPGCRVRTEYQGAKVHRHLVAVGDRAVLLVDLLARGTSATFQHLLHGGAPQEQAELTATGALWTIGGNLFEAVVVSPGNELEYSLAERVDTSTSAQRHAVLSSIAPSVPRVAFLTLLLRQDPSAMLQTTADSNPYGSTIQVTMGDRQLLQASLCTEETECEWGFTLDIEGGADGLLPIVDEDLHRHWDLVGTGW
ncbi:MAG: heparinase II/III family protein [Bradymonadales bacterium]|nr:heparinase II/III family protein [Bradymonadales bacterium]